MIKKKRRGKRSAKSAAAKAGASTHSEPEMSVHALTQDDALVSEVQTFVAKRSELAKKLSDEIKSTEKKLADLKKTAAMLSTDPGSSAAPKERKPMQTKARRRRKKSAKKAPKPEAAPPPETPEHSAPAAE